MTEKDFARMEYNPLSIGKGMMWQKYPFFAKRDLFCTPIEDETEQTLNDMLKFVVLAIDSQSPFFKETDFEYKEKKCFEILHIKEGSDAYKHIKGESDWFQSLVTQYFAHLDNMLFEQWYTAKVRFRQANAYLRTPTDILGDVEKQEKTKEDLTSKMSQRRKEIQKLENELFPNKRLQEKITQYADNEKLTGFAEMFAQPAPYLQKVKDN